MISKCLHSTSCSPLITKIKHVIVNTIQKQEGGRREKGEVGAKESGRTRRKRRWPDDARPRLTPRNRRFERRKERLCAHGAVKCRRCGSVQTGSGRLSPRQNKTKRTLNPTPPPPCKRASTDPKRFSHRTGCLYRCIKYLRLFLIIHATDRARRTSLQRAQPCGEGDLTGTSADEECISFLL